MAPPPWTSPEQACFLTANKPAFLHAQKKGQLERFFVGVYEEWFQKWPVRMTLFPTPEGEIALPLTVAQNEDLQKAVATLKSVSDHFIEWTGANIPFSSAFENMAEMAYSHENVTKRSSRTYDTC